MELIKDRTFACERALYQTRGARIERCVFHDGESPLKESGDLEVADSVFRWRYPLWYCHDVRVEDTLWMDTCRAPVWYTDRIAIRRGTFAAPKGIRRCRGVELEDVSFPNAQETLWNCEGVRARDITVNGDYFAKDCTDVVVRGLDLNGKYPFDGCRRVLVEGALMVTKDAFWNCEDVVVRDSLISGEYLAWNTKRITLERCVIESLQGLCYIDGLTLRDCTFVNTTLAFELCRDIDAEVLNCVDSIANPISGTIRVGGLGQLIQDNPEIDPAQVRIEVANPGCCEAKGADGGLSLVG